MLFATFSAILATRLPHTMDGRSRCTHTLYFAHTARIFSVSYTAVYCSSCCLPSCSVTHYRLLFSVREDGIPHPPPHRKEGPATCLPGHISDARGRGDWRLFACSATATTPSTLNTCYKHNKPSPAARIDFLYPRPLAPFAHTRGGVAQVPTGGDLYGITCLTIRRDALSCSRLRAAYPAFSIGAVSLPGARSPPAIQTTFMLPYARRHISFLDSGDRGASAHTGIFVAIRVLWRAGHCRRTCRTAE